METVRQTRSAFFLDHYNKLEMGTGAGVLSYRGKVYYTCIPDLFELQDKDNDGRRRNSQVASHRLRGPICISRATTCMG